MAIVTRKPRNASLRTQQYIVYEDLTDKQKVKADAIREEFLTEYLSICKELEKMGYDENLPDDKLRLVENPKKFKKDYVVLVAKMLNVSILPRYTKEQISDVMNFVKSSYLYWDD